MALAGRQCRRNFPLRKMARLPRRVAIGCCLFVLACSASDAVILYRTGDATTNTTAPMNDVAGSGWNFEGTYGGFLGTAIAPHFFITAQHFGVQSTVFTFRGTDYHITGRFADPQSDLVIYQLAEELPEFVPLYSRIDEVNQRTVDVGRGTQRGDAFYLNQTQLGWLWGPGDGVKRWGENTFSGALAYAAGWDLLYASFDQNGLTNEATLSGGDSGGAAFLNDNGICKLAGINYGVDGPFANVPDPDDNSPDPNKHTFNAALYDARGLYYQNGPTWELISDPNPVPTAFYPTRISTKLAWICSVVASPFPAREANFLTLTYTKLAIAEVAYVVEQSTDLKIWTTATTTDETISTTGASSVVKSKVDVGNTHALFLRLRTTQP
jgi:hypothetical protein